MASKAELPPQPDGQKTLMEQVREKAAEAAPAVIAAALGATLGYLGAEYARDAAVSAILNESLLPGGQYEQFGDVFHLASKLIAEKTQELPGLFAAIGGGVGAIGAFALGRRKERGSAAE